MIISLVVTDQCVVIGQCRSLWVISGYFFYNWRLLNVFGHCGSLWIFRLFLEPMWIVSYRVGCCGTFTGTFIETFILLKLLLELLFIIMLILYLKLIGSNFTIKKWRPTIKTRYTLKSEIFMWVCIALVKICSVFWVHYIFRKYLYQNVSPM